MNASQPEPPATAFELAAIAAAVDPVLSKAKPAKAVELARQLLLAAQKHIDRPLREERRQDLEWEKLLRRFPDGERVPVSTNEPVIFPWLFSFRRFWVTMRSVYNRQTVHSTSEPHALVR